MPEPFIAEIRMFGGNFAPRNWAYCNGQLLAISQNTALFALIGTTYGGDGRTTFGLPDLRGRAPMHPGIGPGLSQRRLGDEGGEVDVTLSEPQIPAHSHPLQANASTADDDDPANNILAQSEMPGAYSNSPTNLVDLSDHTNDPVGAGQTHANKQPYLGINFIICLNGLFPSRN